LSQRTVKRGQNSLVLFFVYICVYKPEEADVPTAKPELSFIWVAVDQK